MGGKYDTGIFLLRSLMLFLKDRNLLDFQTTCQMVYHQDSKVEIVLYFFAINTVLKQHQNLGTSVCVLVMFDVFKVSFSCWSSWAREGPAIQAPTLLACPPATAASTILGPRGGGHGGRGRLPEGTFAPRVNNRLVKLGPADAGHGRPRLAPKSRPT